MDRLPLWICDYPNPGSHSQSYDPDPNTLGYAIIHPDSNSNSIYLYRLRISEPL